MLASAIDIDPTSEILRIEGAVREQVHVALHRRGVVVGLSGGVDSSVVAALCARALGPGRVLALLMPERDSSPDSLRLARKVASALGIQTLTEDIEPILAATGCYVRQAGAIRQVFPDYDGEAFKLRVPSLLAGNRFTFFQLVVARPDGTERSSRMPADAYLALVAATNFKQRVRKMMEYYHADCLQYAVAGTPNRLEYDQGFFVKQGDGAADIKPIAHLYKSQVYRLAESLGIPEEVRSRPPTTDTFSMPQTQEEFYFAVPFQQMDLCLYGHDHGYSAQEVAQAARMTVEQVERVFSDIASKRRATRYLHAAPMLVEEFESPGTGGAPEDMRASNSSR